ncbi:MAG: hypothetical protein AB1410_09525 [Acidobacteriota bacterium]
MKQWHDQDPTVKWRLAAAYLYAKEKLKLSEEEARNFARTSALRDRFFFEAFRLRHNVGIELIYYVPVLILLIFLGLGFIIKTNWWLYSIGLLFLALWVNARKWSSFWTPFLYWFKPFVVRPVIAEGDLDPTDWRSYYFLPYPHGRANLKQLINACYEEVQESGIGFLARSILYPHAILLGAFLIISYYAW